MGPLINNPSPGCITYWYGETPAYGGYSATTTQCGNVYSIASSTSDITNALTNTGTVVAIVVASILVGMVALMGLGYAIRHIRKLIGRKF